MARTLRTVPAAVLGLFAVPLVAGAQQAGKPAEARGLTVPPAVLGRADEVIR